MLTWTATKQQCHHYDLLEYDPVHGTQLRADDPDEVVQVAQNVNAEQGCQWNFSWIVCVHVS